MAQPAAHREQVGSFVTVGWDPTYSHSVIGPLLNRLRSKSACAGVIGLGYVGLPLLVAFARAGLSAIGFDVDRERTAAISRGESYLGDVTAADVRSVVEARTLSATTDFGELASVDTISICVPTPLRKTRDPDLSYVIAAVERVAAHLRAGQLVVLESTTYPGTIDEVVRPRLEAGGLRADTDFFLAFSPERVDPGSAEWTTRNIPKVVGGGPQLLRLGAEPPLGIRRSELVVKDVAPQIVKAGLAEYEAWSQGTDAAVEAGLVPSMAAQTVTEWARAEHEGAPTLPPVDIIEIPREENRPSGRRFGSLVHDVLASVPFDASTEVIHRFTELQSRILGATDEEAAYAARVVESVLAEPILERAREAAKADRCRRETPVSWRDGERLIEGVVDLAFEEEGEWTLVDFKTDEELADKGPYQRQLGMYALAVGATTAKPVSAFLMRV